MIKDGMIIIGLRFNKWNLNNQVALWQQGRGSLYRHFNRGYYQSNIHFHKHNVTRWEFAYATIIWVDMNLKEFKDNYLTIENGYLWCYGCCIDTRNFPVSDGIMHMIMEDYEAEKLHDLFYKIREHYLGYIEELVETMKEAVKEKEISITTVGDIRNEIDDYLEKMKVIDYTLRNYWATINGYKTNAKVYEKRWSILDPDVKEDTLNRLDELADTKALEGSWTSCQYRNNPSSDGYDLLYIAGKTIRVPKVINRAFDAQTMRLVTKEEAWPTQ